MKFKLSIMALLLVGGGAFCPTVWAQAVSGGALGFPGESTQSHAVIKGENSYTIVSERPTPVYILNKSSQNGFLFPAPLVKENGDASLSNTTVQVNEGQSVTVVIGSEQQVIRRAARQPIPRPVKYDYREAPIAESREGSERERLDAQAGKTGLVQNPE